MKYCEQKESFSLIEKMIEMTNSSEQHRSVIRWLVPQSSTEVWSQKLQLTSKLKTKICSTCWNIALLVLLVTLTECLSEQVNTPSCPVQFVPACSVQNMSLSPLPSTSTLCQVLLGLHPISSLAYGVPPKDCSCTTRLQVVSNHRRIKD